MGKVVDLLRRIDPEEVAVIGLPNDTDWCCYGCATEVELVNATKETGLIITKKSLVEAPDGSERWNHVYCSRCGKAFGRYSNGNPAA